MARPPPAYGVELYRVTGDHAPTGVLGSDQRGRPHRRAVARGETVLPDGVFELVFHAGPYFHSLGVPLTDPPFLDRVVIRFGVAGKTGNYHVPLLLSPYGYSTYRGS